MWSPWRRRRISSRRRLSSRAGCVCARRCGNSTARGRCLLQPGHGAQVTEELVDVLRKPVPRVLVDRGDEPAHQLLPGIGRGEREIPSKLLIASSREHLLEHRLVRAQMPDRTPPERSPLAVDPHTSSPDHASDDRIDRIMTPREQCQGNGNFTPCPKLQVGAMGGARLHSCVRRPWWRGSVTDPCPSPGADRW